MVRFLSGEQISISLGTFHRPPTYLRHLHLRLALPATEVLNPQASKCARGGAWGSAGPKRCARESAPESAREGASGKCLSSSLGTRKRRTSTFPSTLAKAPSRALSGALSRAPRFGPALPQAPPRALFGAWGSSTSAAGKANRKLSGLPPAAANR